ncbi:MAG: UvrB/UvrC motif-containing protein [Candidatus Nealsonbacteria bacterium]|nr:UvrB/UvrC motif-containing protein [Candidatus Nealsonbacteria bacterium]
MEKFKYLGIEQINKLPETPGVYVFPALSRAEGFLYIGKAVNLRDRTKQHRGLLNQVKQLGYIRTDSEIEALILESQLIKKYQPKYNTIWKDDKNYFYVAITKEDYPKVLIVHQKKEGAEYIGPFVEGSALKQTLKILRKIFPYYTQGKHPKGPCPWCRLNLCPGPNPDKKEYQKSIKNLISVLESKKKSVLNNLKQEMKKASREEDFEKAAKLRDQVINLEKIISNAKIFPQGDEALLHLHLRPALRDSIMEAYDVSNIQGKYATGSMVTFINGRPEKNFYRKFRIKMADKPNDTAMLKEILSRRLKHLEWPLPDAILIDGGKAQLNAALLIAKNYQLKTKIMALAKKKNELFIEGKKSPILLKTMPREMFNLILNLRDEAHRFAISYHKKLRAKALLPE